MTASPIAGKYPYVSLETAECVTDSNQSAGPSCYAQQPNAACISTDLKYEIWAKELANDLDRDLKPGFHMSGKSQTIGDFAVSRLSQILPTNENSKS